MESLLVEQSFSPRKQIKNSNRKTPQQFNNPYYHLHQTPRFSNNNISRQASLTSQTYAPPPQVMMHEFDHMMMHHLHGALFLNNHHAPHNHIHGSNSLPPMSLGQHQQPPLLPLPTVSRPAFRSLPPHQPLGRTQSLSPPIVPRKIPTKIKTPPKKENKRYINNTDVSKNNPVKFNTVNPTKKSNRNKVTSWPTKEITDPDPDPDPDPDVETPANDLTRMLLTDLDTWSIFNLAPPPSSLPLPKFYLRQIQQQQPPLPPKLSCNAEVVKGGDGGGATDNLCRLLRLR